ncbi:MAG: sugar kinase [Deltaproteobacteria bacterium]|nr:MAG: sugar kinase [Deltaproteobacteria bacterium]
MVSPSTQERLHTVEVVGLGQACIDYLGRVASYPEEDGKVELMDLQMQCGGPASTALVTLSRMGIRTSFLGSVSDDAFGIEIVKGLKEEKVDHTFLKTVPGHTSQFAFIAVNKDDGRRTIFWTRGSVPHLKSTDVDLSPFPGARILHTDGLMVEASIEGARQAKEMGLTVVMDAGTLREGYRELISMVDVLIASERFGSALVGTDEPVNEALETLSQWGPKEVVITLGPKGSIAWRGGETVSQKALPIDAIDTTGAGDVYHGAYLYGLLKGWTMAECMRFASAASALKCMEMGARKGIPSLEETLNFMKNL